MRILICLIVILGVSGCINAGEFTPERHARYELGKPDCNKNPEKCINGIPW